MNNLEQDPLEVPVRTARRTATEVVTNDLAKLIRARDRDLTLWRLRAEEAQRKLAELTTKCESDRVKWEGKLLLAQEELARLSGIYNRQEGRLQANLNHIGLTGRRPRRGGRTKKAKKSRKHKSRRHTRR